MAKKFLLLLPIILLITAFLAYNTLTSSSTAEAQIYLEEGTVLINNEPLAEATSLEEQDVIETLSDGLATIILYESITVSLNPNTKITVEELTQQHPKLAQEGGETWNTFTNIVGVESYSISAGNSLATVRGTEFSLTEDKIITTEGEVEYRRGEETFKVRKEEVVEHIKEKSTKRSINTVEKEIVKKQRQRTIKQLENLRAREIEKNQIIKKAIIKQLDIEERQIKDHLREIDDSGQDIDRIIEKSPIKTESLEKIARITKEIQKKKGTLRKKDGQQISSDTKPLERIRRDIER
jgi:hypothetical protein